MKKPTTKQVMEAREACKDILKRGVVCPDFLSLDKKLKKYDWTLHKYSEYKNPYGFCVIDCSEPLENECIAECRAKTPLALWQKICKLLKKL